MRDRLVKTFSNAVAGAAPFDHVVVIGGSSNEPELVSLEPRPAKMTFVNLEPLGLSPEHNFVQHDLNSPRFNTELNADLIICNQVLEHVWNHENFFDAIVYNASQGGGMIWISAPASNFEHASPEYFSSGFTSSYLAANLQSRGVEILDSGHLASRRTYLARHLLGLWLSSAEASSPIRSIFSSLTGGSPKYSLRRKLVLAAIALIPESTNSRWQVEAYVLAIRSPGKMRP